MDLFAKGVCSSGRRGIGGGGGERVGGYLVWLVVFVWAYMWFEETKTN